ncbi:MAG: Glu-tRNA(Gln) amidotransferase GatDE subunit E, partial [Candidatus Woesearchaeota archaeon]|nr:Glu-tRNA(Gln) amidotransferase GatDE subunit E [Candidatus Woesearchaeota archaeon]
MEIDYEKIGFKAGIEIHQELNTKKLFCDCASSLKEENLVSTTSRKQRSSAGETGKVDSASAYEHLRDRVFEYKAYRDESCLVELDEEPPHPVDETAFNIALGVSKMFKLNIPDSICVMRKTVTD